MAATTDDLLRIARRCADKLSLSRNGSLPGLKDVEDACEDDIEELLALLQEDEVFGDVDLAEQQKLVDRIEAALPEDRRELVGELTDRHTEHVWLQQEAAYHLGLAVGLKFAKSYEAALEAEEEEEEEVEEDDEF